MFAIFNLWICLAGCDAGDSAWEQKKLELNFISFQVFGEPGIAIRLARYPEQEAEFSIMLFELHRTITLPILIHFFTLNFCLFLFPFPFYLKINCDYSPRLKAGASRA